jgi:predicted DNA-binding protein
MPNQNKRYNLNLSTDLYERIKNIADGDKDITVAHVIRACIKFGLEALEDGQRVIVVDSDNREREVKILL